MTGRLIRIAESLLEYDFDVIYQNRREHVVTGYISRLYLKEMSTAGIFKSDQQIALQKE